MCLNVVEIDPYKPKITKKVIIACFCQDPFHDLYLYSDLYSCSLDPDSEKDSHIFQYPYHDWPSGLDSISKNS